VPFAFLVSITAKRRTTVVLYNPHTAGPRHRSRCAACGGVFFAPATTRPRRFCSDRCRDAARRQRNHELFGVARGRRRGSGGVPRISKNNRVFSKAYKPDFRDRGSGISAHSGVIEIEILAGRSWHEVTSPDGVKTWISAVATVATTAAVAIVSTWSPVTSTIGADLAIPEFLMVARRVAP
jgi:hypothetical protein